VLPDQAITFEDIHNATAITYPKVYRISMTGERLKEVLEDVADNLFNPDPYYQQGGDMVRCGGLGYAIDVSKPIGQRISAMTRRKSGSAIEPKKEYIVAGWASVNAGTEGPPVWELVERHVAAEKNVRLVPNTSVKISGV
jgi:S-sulfosulfanyl-L-cysteine sulfohydrolase